MNKSDPPGVSAGARRKQVEFGALAEFRYQIRRFLRASEDAARAAGVEPQHHQLLLALKGAPAHSRTSVAWLAERLQLNHNSVVGLLNRLAAHDFISRRRDPDDHRRVLTDITPAGDEILHDLSLFHQQELRSRAPDMIKAITAVVRNAHTK